jgi:membrane-associated phospholipid phosphatase
MASLPHELREVRPGGHRPSRRGATPPDGYPPAPMRDLDLKLLRAMRTRGHTPALERAARMLGKAGNNGAGWLLAGAALAAADKPRRSAWAAAAALGPAAIGLNYGIKLVVKRPRPVLEGLPPLGGAPSSLSFPSAHSTSSFAVATAMTRIDRRAALAFVPAIAVAAGRPYLGMHYPSDVAVGVVLGTALGLAVPLPRSESLPPKSPAPQAAPASPEVPR